MKLVFVINFIVLVGNVKLERTLSPRQVMDNYEENCPHFLKHSYTPNCPFGNVDWNNTDEYRCEKMEVAINFQANYIEMLDDRTEDFTVTGEVAIWWYPKCSEYSNPISSQWFVDIEKWWTPNIFHQNSPDDYRIENKAVRFFLLNDGSNEQSPSFFLQKIGSFTSHCDFDLRNFPFDTQNCSLVFVLLQNPSAYEFRATSNWMFGNYSNDFIDLKRLTSPSFGWTVTGRTFDHGKNIISGKEHFVSKFRFTFKRNPAYYVINILIPTAFLSFLNIFVFFLRAAKPERSSLSFAILLALILLRGDVLSKVPENTTVSFLSLYTDLSAIFSWFCTVYFLVFYWLVTRKYHWTKSVRKAFDKNGQILKYIDFYFWCMAIVFFVIHNLVSIFSAIQLDVTK